MIIEGAHQRRLCSSGTAANSYQFCDRRDNTRPANRADRRLAPVEFQR